MGRGKGRIGLELPNQRQPTTGDFDIRPSKVEAWAQALPRGNVGETARQVYQTLHQVNRQQHSASDRFRFLELLREPVRYLVGALSSRFIGVALPLPHKSRQVARLTQALHLEMATGYKAAVEQVLETNILLQDKKLLMVLIHRAIRCLSQATLLNYQIYAPHMGHAWHDLHRLYLRAEALDLHTLPVHDRFNEGMPESSIARCYKQILMLALASPYRLHQGEAATIYRALGHWSAHTNLAAMDEPEAEGALFIVHMNSDDAPDYRAYDRRQCEEGECRLINTLQLSHLLRDELRFLEKHRDEKPEHGLSLNLLHQLYRAWGVAPKRGYSRNENTSQIEVIVGLTALHQALTNAYGKASRSAHRSSYESRTVTMLTARANDIWKHIFDQELPSQTMQRLNEENASLPTYSSQQWTVHNESAGGYRLEVNEPEGGDNHVHVGELLGLRGEESGEGEWAVGVIRWLRQTEKGGLEVGVQILTPQALPIDMEGSRHPGETQRGLLLPELETVGQHASVITPSRLYSKGDQITLHSNGDKSSRIELGKRIQDSGLFHQFAFEPLNEASPSREEEEVQTPSAHEDFNSLWDEL